MMQKTLDIKLSRILADRNCSDFILADAKDADMAYGLSAPGQSPEHYGHEARFRTLDEYREQIRQVVAQGLVDIMLMSANTSEILTIRERIFDQSPITPAIRANDTTDIWLAGAEGVYGHEPSRWFRTATIDHALCGKACCEPNERKLGADLGLYSITFNNDLEHDREALLAYKEFRIEAEIKGFRHFLEVFSPNVSGGNTPQDIPAFVNNHIVRTLAGVTEAGRPVFLKIPYYGPEAMEALARYDSRLVVGILGGSAGTTLDAFQMLADAKKYGARVALYGRKINHAEHQLSFVKYLRAIADSQTEPVEAVKAYHNDLKQLAITPRRSLEDDLRRTETADSYGGRSAAPKKKANGKQAAPDFSKMTAAEKVQWNLDRLKRVFG
ncbi:MAG: hypothetical protein LBU34_02825 [Planctomycetaceae bacterium]|jgi:hypothetical protein|nr:hypothetical protein [Planctomycetaceae bacterium]